LCFSSFTDDATTPSTFHAQCDQYDVTMTVARHGPVPRSSGGASSPAWAEDADWLFGAYVSALPASVWRAACLVVFSVEQLQF
jgi:hypothetical protein